MNRTYKIARTHELTLNYTTFPTTKRGTHVTPFAPLQREVVVLPLPLSSEYLIVSLAMGVYSAIPLP